MALVNFTLPFGSMSTPNWATLSPIQTHHATAVNNLLYGPGAHQEADLTQHNEQYYKNNPYAPPLQQSQHQHQSSSQITSQQSIQTSSHTQTQYRSRNNNNYLPPPPIPQQPQQPQPQPHLRPQYPTQTTQQRININNNNNNNNLNNNNNINTNNNVDINNNNNINYPQTQTTRTYGEGSYTQIPSRDTQPQPQDYNHYNNYNSQPTRTYVPQSVTPIPTLPTVSISNNNNNNNNNNVKTVNNNNNINPNLNINDNINQNNQNNINIPPAIIDTNNGGGIGVTIPTDNYPERPPGFTRVQAGQGGKTQVHAVLDYDDDENEEYYDDDDDTNTGNQKTTMPTVTPIQGPIFIKNGTVPVVPLYAYPTINNGSFVQIPIWWTALSVALGLDIRGDIIRGVPCIKRYHQLFCPTAGNSYPIDKIERFIDDNKALMRRMYGDFEMSTQYGPPNKKRKRNADINDFHGVPPGVPDMIASVDGAEDPVHDISATGDSYFDKWRSKRQTQSFRGTNTRNNSQNQGSRPTTPSSKPTANQENTGRLDACESKVEIVTPYWASNSAGKIRAIVNTQHFEQAIHQEVCVKVQTSRCGGDCGCEQKYKWHRLLAYDPDNDCKGIFMDWFLFPSCCVCRCNPL